MTINSLVIDPEFSTLIPPMGAEELAQLEANIRQEGCRDPLVVWDEPNILLDGHHRYDICTRHRLAFTVRPMSFDSREAAADWMDANQLGRRNLAPDALSLLRGRRYNRGKKLVGVRGPEKLAQGEPTSTAATLAQQHGVSPATIKRDGAFASAVESLKPIIPDIEQRVVSGDISSRGVVLDAARHPEQAEAIIQKAHVGHATGNNEWDTPVFLLDAARAVMGGFDCDPASSDRANARVQAARYYTEQTNGLDKPWGERVWMNPPYAQPLINQFVEALAERVSIGQVRQAVVLVNNATETAWGQELLYLASALCFVRGRVKFLDTNGDPGGAPLQGQMAAYIGPNTEAFLAAFDGIGVCLRR